MVHSRILIAGAVTVACTATPSPVHADIGHSLLPLTQVSAERIKVADLVAAAKYGTTLPIDDPAREQQLLDTVTRKSLDLGIDPGASTRIFRDQIEASKIVQRGLIARWTAHPDQAPTERPDLIKDVRPILDRITDQLLAELKATMHLRTRPSCAGQLTAAYVRVIHRIPRLDALHAGALARALPSVCSTPGEQASPLPRLVEQSS